MTFAHLKTIVCGAICCVAIAATAQGQTVVEDFEYASSDPAAQAGGSIYQGTAATVAIGSGTGADASEGTYSLRADVAFNGVAFDNVNIERFLTAPYVLSSPIAAGNLAADFAVRLDIKGNAAFGAGAFGTNLFVYLFDADGDIFRFINFTDAALASPTFTTDHSVAYFDNSTVANGTLEQVNAVQILFQDADGDTSAVASAYIDKLVFEENPAPPAGGQSIDDFESAVDNTAAAANWAVGVDGTVTLAPVSGTGADANQGTYALGLNLTMAGAAFESGFVSRTLGTPVTLSQAYTVGGPAGQTPADLAVTLDVKGDAAFGSDTNVWLRLKEADGDIWRYIAFNDATLGSATYSDDHGIAFFDRDGASTGDASFTEITGYDILIQNPVATAKSGIIYVDDFRIEEPAGPPTTGLTYTIPVIPAVQAPNVTDSVFDAIYSNSGAHPVIEGDDWKDYAQAGTDPGAGISTNGDATAAAGIFATSKAYLVSDGQFIYFGMRVWDPNTALITADTANETFTKWNVESIEVAFSALSGTSGAGTAFKVAMDGFSQIDDMMPDGNVAVNTVALTNNNSYIIDANTWALEWKVDINELVTLSQTNLTTPLPAPSVGNWFGHIGYQSPGARSVISPLYAAGHAGGFGNFTVEFDLSNIAQATAVSDWSMY